MGKFLNTLGIFLLFCLAAMPVFGAVLFLVGLERGQIIGAFMTVVCTAATCALMALATASVVRYTLRAVVISYGLMTIYMGLPLLMLILIADAFELFSDRWLLAMGESFTALGLLFAVSGKLTDYLPYAVYSALIGLLCFAVAWIKLRSAPETAEALTPQPSRWWRRRGRARGVRYDTGDVVTFPDRANPIPRREVECGGRMRRRVIRNPWLRIVLFVVAGLVFLAWAEADHFQARDAILVWLVLESAFLAVVAPAFIANLVTKEHELGNMDLLRSTLLRPRDVILGKAYAGYALVRPLLAAELAACVPLLFVATTTWDWTTLTMGLGMLLVTGLVAVSLSILASTLARRTGVAMVLAYVFNALVFFGASLILIAIFETVGIRPRPYGERIMSFPSPIVGTIIALEEYALVQYARVNATSSDVFYPGYASAVTLMPWRFWGACLLAHVASSAGYLALAIRMYKRRIERT
jgi:hypothetical protein